MNEKTNDRKNKHSNYFLEYSNSVKPVIIAWFGLSS